jgi:predicted secreted protein
MAAIVDGFLGRDIDFFWGGNSPGDQILGVREKGIEINGEAVDVTSDENNGWRALLTEPGQKEISLSISGVTKDDRMKQDWFGNRRMQAVTLRYPDGATVSGTFFMQSCSDTGPYNDATTFECELLSNGEVTYTPAA